MFVDFLPPWGFDGDPVHLPYPLNSNGVFTGDPGKLQFKLNPNGSLTGDPRLTPIYKELQWEFDQRREGGSDFNKQFIPIAIYYIV